MSADSASQEWSPLRPPEMTILADHAILHGDERDDDLLGLAPKLAAVFDILRNKNTQTPIAVAIYGGWGTGKSSAMRWLRDRLQQWNCQDDKKREGHPAIETVWFDPWKYQSRDDVWRGLIAEVILACLDIGRPAPDTKVQWIERAARQFGTYVGRPFLAALARIKIKARAGDTTAGVEAEISGEAFTAVLDELRKVRKPHEPYLNEFEGALQSWVREFFPQKGGKGTPRRLAVLIDDLDRCLPAVSLQVLEALKLYLNIPGLLFVVGLDRQVLDAVVCTEYAKHGIKAEKSREYLAKMFQVQVDIPPTQAQAREFLKMQIAELDKASDYAWGKLLDESSLDPKDRFREIIEGKIAVLGSDNPREIKRLLNSVMLRAWAAAQNDKLDVDGKPRQRRARRFAQGAQVFLVQRFLWRGLEREDLLLRDDVQEFFERWSQFVCKFPSFKAGKRASGVEAETSPGSVVAIAAERTPEVRADFVAPAGGGGGRGGRGGTPRPPEPRVPTPEEQGYEALRASQPVKQLLADPHLWDLMRIPFSVAVASVSVAEAPVSVVTAVPPHPPPASEDDLGGGVARARSPGPTGGWPRPLAIAIARALDKPVSELTEGDAQRVRSLALSGNADLSDLTPLAGLTQLQALGLDQTSVTDLTPLAGLTQLHWLRLSETGAKDLTPLGGLTQLQVLYLNQTGVTDLTPLAGLTRLQRLALDQTRVTDLTPLAGLTQLQQLQLNQTGVTDVTPLAGLTQLQNLFLTRTGVKDLTALRKLGRVTIYVDDPSDLRVPPELEQRVVRLPGE